MLTKSKRIMKRAFIAIVVALFTIEVASAQTVEESSTLDNWYVGIDVGLNAKTTHTSIFSHLNPSASMRIGHYLTPVFGFAVEGDVYFNNKGSEYRPLDTFVKGLNLSLLGTTNFSNWIGGYKGEPRFFEVIGVYGLGWGHVFHSSGSFPDNDDALTSKIGIDFAFNLGTAKEWQVYVEPNLTWSLNDCTEGGVKYNLNRSAFGLAVGVNYKFGNSNGTHNFKIYAGRDQEEIDALNAKINQLRADNTAKDGTINAKNGEIAKLKAALDECNSRGNDTIVIEKDKNVLQPTVVFGQGKSTIDNAQYANVSMVASYMKNHSDATILIKGYASPEGNAELNQTLSEKRAEACKTALVKKYGISESRISTVGLGATDELFEELEFNRVCTFTDTSK